MSYLKCPIHFNISFFSQIIIFQTSNSGITEYAKEVYIPPLSFQVKVSLLYLV